jgi:hypothetical protein
MPAVDKLIPRPFRRRSYWIPVRKLRGTSATDPSADIRAYFRAANRWHALQHPAGTGHRRHHGPSPQAAGRLDHQPPRNAESRARAATSITETTRLAEAGHLLSRRHQNRLIGTRPHADPGSHTATNNRRYGVFPRLGVTGASCTDRHLASSASAAYAAFLVHCWGLAAGPCLPGLSRSGRCPMTATIPSTALVTVQPVFTDSERLARRVPGRVSRPDPRGLHAGPAAVHRVVPHPLAVPVLGPAR